MKFLLSFFVLIVVVIVGWLILSSNSDNSQEDNTPQTIQQQNPSTSPNITADHTASFAIFTNGTARTFTNPDYHNLSADVFIEASNPHVIHVKKTGITWDDFFKTLPFSLERDCLTTGTGQIFCTNSNSKLKFYINGNPDDDALDRIINAGDQLLVSYGDKNDATIQDQLLKIPPTE